MSNGGSGERWWFALGNAKVGRWATHVLDLKLPSLSSRNTLGDTSHNSNKLKQNWVKLGVVEVYGGHAYAEMVVVVDEEAIVPK